MSHDQLFDEIEAILSDLTDYGLPSMLFEVSPATLAALRRFVLTALTSSAQERNVEMFVEQLTTFGFQMFLAGREHASRGLADPAPGVEFSVVANNPAELFAYLDADEDA
jgi:hypothetical protein